MREMRRKDRLLSEAETRELLENAEYGVLSTVDEDGMPYGVPMSYAYEDGCLYMHCSIANGHKKSNIAWNPKASFTVVSNVELQPEIFATKYMSAIAFGNAKIVTDPDEKRKGIEAILKRYSSDYMDAGIQYIERAFEKIDIIKFTIEELSGKGKK